jgi:WD40 repeat protein
LINAHESAISYIALNSDGTLLATASDKGTLIRIFRAEDGTFLQELRRGKDKAEIHHICFDPYSKLIASTSDKGTIHIWSLSTSLKKMKDFGDVISVKESIDEESKNAGILPENKQSIFKGLPKIFSGSYFKSEWSFAQFRLDDPNTICSFGPNNTIIAISSVGKYYQAQIDMKKGGECVLLQENSLFSSDK